MKLALLTLSLFILLTATEGIAMTEIDSLWNHGDPAASRDKFVAEQAKITPAQDNERWYELQTQIARSYSLQGDFESAHALLDPIKANWEQVSPRVKIRYYLERGRCFNSAKKRTEALPLFQAALELSQSEGADFYAVDAAHMLAIASAADQQIQWNLKAMEIAEASSDARAKKWLGSLYNNLGWTYHDLKDYSQALSLFEKCQAWHEEQQSTQGLLIARWTVARVHRSLGHWQEALSLQQNLLQDRQRLELGNDGYVYEEIAENLLALDRKTEASYYFEKAFAFLSQDSYLQKNEADRLQRLQRLAAD